MELFCIRNNMKEKRFEILGILILTVSLLLLISFLGHNPNEDPGISPNIRVENPMGGVCLRSYLTGNLVGNPYEKSIRFFGK